MTRLTDKQEKYVQELLKGKSQRQAYRIAYPKSQQWTESAVDTQASILFKNSKVRARYDQLKGRLLKEAEDECILQAKDVLKELTKIGFSDIGNYLSYQMEKTSVIQEDAEQIADHKVMIHFLNSAEVDTTPIQEVSVGKDGTFKFKLYDKQKALERLGEHLGIFDKRKEESSSTLLADAIQRAWVKRSNVGG